MVNSSRFDILPIEIIDHIYSYLHELSNCLDDIKIKGCYSRMEQIVKYWIKKKRENENYDLAYVNYLYYNLQDPQHVVTHLSKCNCCSRHQKNKPKSLNDVNYLNYLSNNNLTNINQDTHSCECSCRHDCRFIHNTWNTVDRALELL